MSSDEVLRLERYFSLAVGNGFQQSGHIAFAGINKTEARGKGFERGQAAFVFSGIGAEVDGDFIAGWSFGHAVPRKLYTFILSSLRVTVNGGAV